MAEARCAAGQFLLVVVNLTCGATLFGLKDDAAVTIMGLACAAAYWIIPWRNLRGEPQAMEADRDW